MAPFEMGIPDLSAVFEDTRKRFQEHLTKSYPVGTLPIVVPTAPEKSFLVSGGSDPLVFIYIFKNQGDPTKDTPRHWHYVSSGLTDILGYTWQTFVHNRACEEVPGYEERCGPPRPLWYPVRPDFVNHPHNVLNGFGFELTFRLRCDSDIEWNQEPPAWPRQLMQKLANYVFKTKNVLQVGDHVSVNEPLDGSDDSWDTSIIRHVLFTFDPQLSIAEISSFGSIRFIQMVGVCEEELTAAQDWEVRGVLDMMRTSQETGGQFLVTDMRRGLTVFQLNPQFHEIVRRRIEITGSNMVQSCASHKTSSREQDWYQVVEDYLRRREEGQNPTDLNLLLVRDQHNHHDSIHHDESIMDTPSRPASRMSQGSESALRYEFAENLEFRYYDRIYILLSLEAAKKLPVMLYGRLRHKREFSFQNYRGDSLVTFQPEDNARIAVACPEHPFVRKGHWLQIYVSNRLLEQMIETIGEDFNRGNSTDQLSLPKNYAWPEFKLYLTVVEEIPG